MTRQGRLLLVPAPLDFGCDTPSPLSHVLPEHTLQTAAQLEHWICENAKSARAYLKRVHEICPMAHSLQALQIQELPREFHKKGDHDASGRTSTDAKTLLAPALSGHDIGL